MVLNAANGMRASESDGERLPRERAARSGMRGGEAGARAAPPGAPATRQVPPGRRAKVTRHPRTLRHGAVEENVLAPPTRIVTTAHPGRQEVPMPLF